MEIKNFLIGLGSCTMILPTPFLGMDTISPPSTLYEYQKREEMYLPFYSNPKKSTRGYGSSSIEVHPQQPLPSAYAEPLSTEEPAPSQEKTNKNFDQPPEPMQKQEITPRLIIIPEE